MKDEEIKKIMQEYTDALKREKGEAHLKSDDAEDVEEARLENFVAAKDKVHKIAMQCLDKILTPELKVFVKNLCLDRLHYPDDPIFYKAFGEYPEIGDKISVEELESIGINWVTFTDARDIWNWEDSCYVLEDTIDGKNYFVIGNLYEKEHTDMKEKREILKTFSKLKRYICKDSNIDIKTKGKFLDCLEKISPLIEKLGV